MLENQRSKADCEPCDPSPKQQDSTLEWNTEVKHFMFPCFSPLNPDEHFTFAKLRFGSQPKSKFDLFRVWNMLNKDRQQSSSDSEVHSCMSVGTCGCSSHAVPHPDI